MNGYNVDRTASEAANLSDDAGSLKPRPTSARKSRLLGYSLLPPNYRKLHLPRNCNHEYALLVMRGSHARLLHTYLSDDATAEISVCRS